MGIRNFIQSIKEKAEQSKADSVDPKKQAEKRTRTAKSAIKWAQKGAEIANKVDGTLEELRDQSIEISKKIDPIAGQIDDKAQDLTKDALSGLSKQKAKLSDAFSSAKEKLGDMREKRAIDALASAEEKEKRNAIRAEEKAKKDEERAAEKAQAQKDKSEYELLRDADKQARADAREADKAEKEIKAQRLKAKIQARRDKQPTSGFSFLDAIVPVIPETDATKALKPSNSNKKPKL